MKKAVISIDVEDWFHLDYFERSQCDESYSMMDGLDYFIDIVEKENIKSSFFVLGEIAKKNIDFYSDLSSSGHDISSHGWNHLRPMTLSLEDFTTDINNSYEVLKKINTNKAFGYRAPCFSIDSKRLSIVEKTGFSYDSSKIEFGDHPLYENLDLNAFSKHSDGIFYRNKFLEFEVSTHKIFDRNIPISGGGYLRILPWYLFKSLLKKYIENNDLYVLYIHPFELSELASPDIQKLTSPINKFRFNYGRNKVKERILKTLHILDENGFEFTTFNEIYKRFVNKTE